MDKVEMAEIFHNFKRSLKFWDSNSAQCAME